MLAATSPFSELSEEDLLLISQHGQLRTLPKNAVVITAGEPGSSFYFIASGAVKVFASDAQGKEVTLGRLDIGEYFGELSLFDEAPRSASVITMEATKLRVLSKETFYMLLGAHPGLAFKLIVGLSRVIRGLIKQVEDLALLDVYGRLRHVLHELRSEAQSESLTHQDLASRIGSSREMVSRIMKTLVEGGYVRVQRKRVNVLKDLPERW